MVAFVVVIEAISHKAPQRQRCDIVCVFSKMLAHSCFEIKHHDMKQAYSFNKKGCKRSTMLYFISNNTQITI